MMISNAQRVTYREGGKWKKGAKKGGGGKREKNSVKGGVEPGTSRKNAKETVAHSHLVGTG